MGNTLEQREEAKRMYYEEAKAQLQKAQQNYEKAIGKREEAERKYDLNKDKWTEMTLEASFKYEDIMADAMKNALEHEKKNGG